MSSQQFQAAHESIYNTGTRLLQYLREMRAGQLSEGNDTKGLQSVEDDITKALNALKEQKYQVAVIAAMNAGKSTFLNSLIGADVLASERESCTVSLTNIRPIAAGQTPRLFEYRERKEIPILLAEGEPEVIRQKFLERTRQIRDPHNSDPDKTVCFELEHPIEAISELSSLAGFTLVDTPGPNELESPLFNSVALKKTALEALRTCDAILFVLDYTSFRDDTNSELLKELEQRREALAENTGKIYFILNKVDQKGANDRAINDVILDLKKTLINFGIPAPIVYSASARQGLLAKLIQQGTATDSQNEDFIKFFAASYAQKDEMGRLYIPALPEIAPQALQDSGISTIEESVIKTVIQNSGWNLLSNVLAKIDKAAKAIEDTLNTRLSGWEMEFETLKGKIEEYRKRSDAAKEKVEAVKKSVEEQKQILIEGFGKGLSIFADGAKAKIKHEIDLFANSRSSKDIKVEVPKTPDNSLGDIFEGIGETSATLLEIFLGKLGKGLGAVIKGGFSFLPDLIKATSSSSIILKQDEDPYIIRCNTSDEAKKIADAISACCAPHIENWWINTQDELVKGGAKVREKLVLKIKEDIQQISNELSDYLGNALQVELNISPIQFPSFEFPGIDAQIRHQIERIRVIERGLCNSEKTYDIPFSTYEVDLRQAGEAIKQNIDKQVSSTQKLLQLVIHNQVREDFRNAEKQISDYINRFQIEFDCLLRERETRGAEADQIRAILESQKAQLKEYLSELFSIRESLYSWKPLPIDKQTTPFVPPQYYRNTASATNLKPSSPVGDPCK